MNNNEMKTLGQVSSINDNLITFSIDNTKNKIKVNDTVKISPIENIDGQNFDIVEKGIVKEINENNMVVDISMSFVPIDFITDLQTEKTFVNICKIKNNNSIFLIISLFILAIIGAVGLICIILNRSASEFKKIEISNTNEDMPFSTNEEIEEVSTNTSIEDLEPSEIKDISDVTFTLFNDEFKFFNEAKELDNMAKTLTKNGFEEYRQDTFSDYFYNEEQNIDIFANSYHSTDTDKDYIELTVTSNSGKETDNVFEVLGYIKLFDTMDNCIKKLGYPASISKYNEGTQVSWYIDYISISAIFNENDKAYSIHIGENAYEDKEKSDDSFTFDTYYNNVEKDLSDINVFGIIETEDVVLNGENSRTLTNYLNEAEKNDNRYYYNDENISMTAEMNENSLEYLSITDMTEDLSSNFDYELNGVTFGSDIETLIENFGKPSMVDKYVDSKRLAYDITTSDGKIARIGFLLTKTDDVYEVFSIDVSVLV